MRIFDRGTKKSPENSTSPGSFSMVFADDILLT